MADNDRSEYIRKNVEASRQATEASRICKSGLTDRKVKLNAPNFDKLMKQRGLSKQARTDLKNSNLQGAKLQVRHAKAGDQFVTTHGTERSSGVFVSEKSFGSTQENESIKELCLIVIQQNLRRKLSWPATKIVYGKIAPQSKFSKMDPKQQPRNGGGEQVITDGGYDSGAVRTKDPKYPVPAKQSIMQRANEHKAQHGIKTSTAQHKSIATAHAQSKSKGQSRS